LWSWSPLIRFISGNTYLDRNVGKRWPAERTDAILQKFWALDRTNDVRSLLGGLSLQA
jgi:hypothetical protein